MKKLYLLCAVALVLGLVGCHADAPVAEQPTEPPALNVQLSEERKAELEEKFFIQFIEHYPECDCEYLTQYVTECVSVHLPEILRYLGTFDGREVVYMNCYLAWTPAYSHEYIAGYIFWFPWSGGLDRHSKSIERNNLNSLGSGVHIWLYDDGYFIGELG